MSDIRRSDSISALATALSSAQAQMRGAIKDATNPHFRSSYADLASVWEACRESLTAHKLSVVQSPRSVFTEAGLVVEVETLLLHASGEWLADTLAVPCSKADAQGVGSAITYARRYALAAVVGVAPADDDGEAAVGRDKAVKKAVTVPDGYQDWLTDLVAVAETGTGPLKGVWTHSEQGYRDYLTTTAPEKWEMLKKKAAIATAKAEKVGPA